MKTGMRSIIPVLFGLLGMGAKTPPSQLTVSQLTPPAADSNGFTKSRRTGGGYGNQTWRIYLTATGWRLDFKRTKRMTLTGRRWARKNRRWLGGENPKKRSFFAYPGNPNLATAA